MEAHKEYLKEVVKEKNTPELNVVTSDDIKKEPIKKVENVLVNKEQKVDQNGVTYVKEVWSNGHVDYYKMVPNPSIPSSIDFDHSLTKEEYENVENVK